MGLASSPTGLSEVVPHELLPPPLASPPQHERLSSLVQLYVPPPLSPRSPPGPEGHSASQRAMRGRYQSTSMHQGACKWERTLSTASYAHVVCSGVVGRVLHLYYTCIKHTKCITCAQLWAAHTSSSYRPHSSAWSEN